MKLLLLFHQQLLLLHPVIFCHTRFNSLSSSTIYWEANTSQIFFISLFQFSRSVVSDSLGARGEGDDRGWDGWMALLARWTWVWVNSRSWWWTGRPGMLQFMGLQRVGHDWATELNWMTNDWASLHVHVSHLCHLWRTVYSRPLPSFQLGFFLYCKWLDDWTSM